MLSNLLKWARIGGYIPWDDIIDRMRVYHDLTGWNDAKDYIEASMEYFLNDYARNLLQSQGKYIEIWIEKDALSSIFTRVAALYTVPVVVCRGFSSISFLHDFTKRLQYCEGKKQVMLYFGDFDPSGVEMLEAMKTTLNDELGVQGVEFKRIALLREDIFKYKLPHNPNALKKKDTRARKHIEAYGELAVELDALRPDVLQEKIKKAVEVELDVKTFNREVKIFKRELNKLNEIRKGVQRFLVTEVRDSR